MGISTLMALGGVFCGYLIWGAKLPQFTQLYRRRWVRAAQGLLANRYYLDHFYDGVIVRAVMALAKACWSFDIWVVDLLVNAAGAGAKMFAYAYAWFDLWVVDGLVNLAGYVWLGLKRVIRPVQSGYLQHYMLVVLLAIIVFWAVKYLF